MSQAHTLQLLLEIKEQVMRLEGQIAQQGSELRQEMKEQGSKLEGQIAEQGSEIRK